MNQGTRRHELRFYLYFSFIAICMAGVMQISTVISSSHSLNTKAKNAAEHSAGASLEAELFYPNKDNRASARNRRR